MFVWGRHALRNPYEFFIHSVDETTLAYTRRDREEEREEGFCRERE